MGIVIIENPLTQVVTVVENSLTQVVTVVEKGPRGDMGPRGPSGMPTGGLTGQVLVKLSDADGDVGWMYPLEG